MAQYPKPKLSLLERLFVVLKVVYIFSYAFFALITGPFFGYISPSKLLAYVKITVCRLLANTLSAREIQSIAEPLDVQYPRFAKAEGFQPARIILDDDSRAYWFGDLDAPKVLIWFHGGGYTLPPDVNHLPFAKSLTTPTISVLMLAYSLTPYATYPTQLKQAAALLTHLIHDRNFPPKNISLAGDSAGANLALSLISHLLHPHPAIEKPLKLGNSKLNGLILLGPWVSFDVDANKWPSFKTNARRDVNGPKVLVEFSNSLLGGEPSDAYNEPLTLDAGDPWWKGLERVVREIQVVAGGDEVLLDSIKEMARRLEAAHPRVETVIVDGEFHVQPVNIAGGGGRQAEVIRSFVKNKL